MTPSQIDSGSIHSESKKTVVRGGAGWGAMSFAAAAVQGAVEIELKSSRSHEEEQ
jgi:hypothetical protein